MKIKLAMVAIVASMGLCAQGFGFELLNNMLGMGGYGGKGCCDGATQKHDGCTHKAGGHVQKCGGCGLFGHRCHGGKATQKTGGDCAQKGSVQKGHCGLFGGRHHCGKGCDGGKTAQKSHHCGTHKGSVQKGHCRTPLFGHHGCGCDAKGGKATQKGGCGCHGGLLHRLFSCHSCGCGGKGGKGMTGPAQVPADYPADKYPADDDSSIPPAPAIDPASFIPQNVTALAR